jgi:hypothetical protein
MSVSEWLITVESKQVDPNSKFLTVLLLLNVTLGKFSDLSLIFLSYKMRI